MSAVTIDAAREQVYQRWVDQWGSTTPYMFENETDKEPTSSATTPEWCRVTVKNLDSNLESMGGVGNRRYQRLASLFIQIQTPINTGMKRSAVLAKQARDIFEGVRLGEITFNDVVVRETGQDGKWQSTLVDCSFEYPDLK